MWPISMFKIPSTPQSVCQLSVIYIPFGVRKSQNEMGVGLPGRVHLSNRAYAFEPARSRDLVSDHTTLVIYLR
ncbi:hypothetical protein BS47DRAFT_1350706, partial [Hydnum rufescens UP504]